MMKQPAPFNGKSDLISGRLAVIGRETRVSNHYFPILFQKIIQKQKFQDVSNQRINRQLVYGIGKLEIHKLLLVY